MSSLAPIDLDAIVRRLREAFPTILAVYVFGSRAEAAAGLESDLDLAVLVEGRADPLALWALSNDLAEIARCPVDLVDLRAASTVMQYQIITKGRRLWQRDVRAGVYEAFILSEKTELDTARAALMAEIERDGRVHGR